jgi:membrane-associated PAP2 superfamily phosphatase
MWWWIGGGVVGAIVIVVALVALMDVIRRRGELTRAQVSAYVILILVVPVVGAVLYGLFGRQGAGRPAG